jgi:LPS O-antigen subunit length determinant protein (WzzB/FepE family)
MDLQMTKVISISNENNHHPTIVDGSFVEHNQIDLSEIFSVLLESKKVIALITALFMVLGLSAGLLLPQKWTSSSVIVAPTETESMELNSLLNELTVAGVTTGISTDYLLKNYIQYFDSGILRDNYLQKTDYFKMLLNEGKDDELQKRLLLDSISNNISTSGNNNDKPGDTKAYTYYRLNLSAQTPEAAKDLLQGYMGYVEKSANEYVLYKIQRAVALKLASEQELYQRELQKVQNQRDVRIKRISYSLSIADAAGLKKPVYSNGTVINDDPDYSITLGADALRQKLAVEKSITDPLMMSTDLRNRKMNIDLLSKINIANVEFKPYKLLQKPENPSKKDSPKKLIVLILFTLIGFVVAIGTVLLRNMYMKHKENTAL